MKVSRVAVLIKSAYRELCTMRSPRSVRNLKFDGKTLDRQTEHGIHAFFAAFAAIFILSILILSMDGQDHVSNLTAVAACINNICPALGVCGPVGNYAPFSDLSKLVLSFDMLAGRLEVFPMLMLFTPTTYRKK